MSINKLLTWLDKYALLILATFLIVFIPLYPKLPLFEAIPGYIVRVRLEDILIAVTFGVWFIQILRKKVTYHPLVTKLILAYLVVGLLSSISAIFITQTVPQSQVHVAKLFLHYFRRIEYFSLFFIMYSAINSIKQAKFAIGALLSTSIAAALYGFGQKYFYWPVYSTMNREFSKGIKLYLTEHARVPSTFGGHYDAAAYVMIVITIALTIVFLVKNKWLKLLGLLTFATGMWLLILTASRSSSISYLFAMTVTFFVAGLIKSWKWAIPRWLIASIVSVAIMLSFGDLSNRFSQVLGLEKLKEKYYTQLFAPKVSKPENYLSTDELAKISSPSDQPPVKEKPDKKQLPADVHEDIPEKVVDEVDEEGNKTGKKVAVSRTYSDNAYKYGLSAAIRFDALWPRAWEGFKRNPLLGSGYSTLTKASVEQFTEAESTDNDYLRNLGETGLLGFGLFFGTVITVIYLSIQGFKNTKDPLLQAFLIGFAGAGLGLMLNASYIDVFEASKVAYTFWGLAGLALAIKRLTQKGVTK